MRNSSFPFFLFLLPSSTSSQLSGYFKRRDALLHLVRGSHYETQKSRLAEDFCSFLLAHSGLPPPFATAPSPETASPEDVGKFLFFRDSRGRTQIHAPTCPFKGQHGLKDCGCRVGLAAGTINSMIGKLRAFFNSRGQTQPYSSSSRYANPCNSTFIKDWLKSAYKEQRLAQITPHQAPIIFSTHLRLLAAEIARRIASLHPSTPIFQRSFASSATAVSSSFNGLAAIALAT